MNRYPDYKDSGLEWTDEIPADWRAAPIKHIAIVNRDALSSNTDPYYRLRYIDIGNVDSEGNVAPPQAHRFEDAPSRARRIVERDDTIVSTVRTYLKAVAFIDGDDTDLIASTGFATLTPSDDIAPKYLYYLMTSQGVVDAVSARSVGVSYPAINSSDLADISVPLPPLDEQRQLAAYLDRKTAEVDTLIRKKQALIARLGELRAALIHRAVTKGLDPDVPMKDSGVEWLGEVPEHWDVVRIKHVLTSDKDALKTGPFGSQLKNSDLVESGIKVYTQRHVLDDDFSQGDGYITEEKFGDLAGFETFPGDLLITTRGTIGKCAVLPESAERGILHPCLIRVQLDPQKMDTAFLAWYVQHSASFRSNVAYNSNATTIEVIYGGTLRDVYLPAPPLSEQAEILSYLEETYSRLDHILSREEDLVLRLRELRTSLISEVVTGKVDVRAEAARLGDAAEEVVA